MKVPVSILIPIKNEAANLPRCLAAVAWADEIFVVDSNSTDGSQEIVERFAREAANVPNSPPSPLWGEGRGEVSPTSDLRSPTSDLRPPTSESSPSPLWGEGRGEVSPTSDLRSPTSGASVKLVQFAFNGTWPKKKNWALENLPFKHEWVFILDADEVMPPEAEAEFRAIVTRDQKSESSDQQLEVRSPTSDLRSPTSESSPSPRWGESRGEVPPASGLRPPTSESSPSPLWGEGRGEVPLASELRPPTSDEVVGYWINRRFMFMGQWLKHAYYPNWNLRLFKHRLGRYEKLTDVATASGDNEVHEHVVVNGQTGHLKCEMDHYAFPSVDVFVEKHNRYSNWEARVALDRALKGSSQSLQSKQVGMLRRLKQLSQRLPFRPLQRFLYVYLWQRGFLDGVAGWHFARLHAMYEYLCVVKTVELKKRQRLEIRERKAEVGE